MLALFAALLIGGPAADPEPARGSAKLAIVQGPIEISPAAAAPKAGDEIEVGVTIKTPAGSRATFDFADGTELRVNENTELVLEGPRMIDLKKGRILLKVVKAGGKFDVHNEYVGSSANQALMEIEYQPRIPNGEPAHTYFRVLEGTARTTSKKFNANVFAGFNASALGSQLNTPDPVGNGAIVTSWVNPLLLERGRIDEETTNRAQELVQDLGRQDANDPAEAALRTFGDLGTAELVRMLTRSANGPKPARRAAAVKIIAETGTMKSADGLLSLLQNPEADTRVVAARGLARLAGGKDLGFNDQFWKGESLEKGLKAWEDWVKQNAK